MTMGYLAVSFLVGLVFGLGLVISQMVNPAKVIGFLDVAGRWDPSLALVLLAAVLVAGVGYRLARHRNAPLMDSEMKVPTRRDIDGRLVAGAAVFGVGWGLIGLCPGPALTALAYGKWEAVLFVAAMAAGVLLHAAYRRLGNR